MPAKNILAFIVAVAISLVAASHTFRDSGHAVGILGADGGRARHAVLLDPGRRQYVVTVTGVVKPPYRGNARVVLEGEPQMDYQIHFSRPVIDLGMHHGPSFADGVLEGLEPRDRFGLRIVMRPKDPHQFMEIGAQSSKHAVVFYDTETSKSLLRVPLSIILRRRRVMTNRTKQRLFGRYRNAILILSVVLFLPPLALVFQLTGNHQFCGTWCPRMFFVWRQGETLGAYSFGFLRSYMGVTLVAGVLVTTYLFGRHWCSHVCPIGGLMELGSRLVPRFLKIDFSAIPAPAFRYGYLSVYLLAPAFGIGSLGCSYCSFGTVPRLVGAAFSPADAVFFLRTAGLISLGLVIVLGFLAKGGRANCNLICPVGALDAVSNALGAKFGWRRMFIARSKCNECGKCAMVCPVAAIKCTEGKAEIDQLCCMPCRMCENTCPQGAIGYGKAFE